MLLLTMVNHGWQCFLPTMVNHGWLRCHFTNLWLTMVDHGLEKLCQTMVNHGWLWFKKPSPNHGHPWLTMVDWPTMVNHGQLSSIFFYLFLVKTPIMAEPWPANLRLVQVPSLLVENRYKVSLLTWDSFNCANWSAMITQRQISKSADLHQIEYLCKAHIFV